MKDQRDTPTADAVEAWLVRQPRTGPRYLFFVEGLDNAEAVRRALALAGIDNVHVEGFTFSAIFASPDTLPIMAAFAAPFTGVLVWADEGKAALAVAKALPHAVPLKSPNGLDANDLLQAGKLAPFLATVLARLGWMSGP